MSYLRKRKLAEVAETLADYATTGSPGIAATRALYKRLKPTVYRHPYKPNMPAYSRRRRRYSKRRTAIRRNRGKAAYRKRRSARIMRGTVKAYNKGTLMKTLQCPFGNSKKATLVWNFYEDRTHGNAGSADYGTVRWNCSNPQFPVNGTPPTTTGQARWGDTLNTLYERYICTGSKITVKIRNTGSTTTNSTALLCALFLYPVDQGTDAAGATHPYNEMKMSPYRVTPFKVVNAGASPVTLSATWSLKRTKQFNLIQGSTTSGGDYYVKWEPTNASAPENLTPRQWRYALVIFNQDPADVGGTTTYLIEQRVAYYTKWVNLRANNTVAVTPNAMDND